MAYKISDECISCGTCAENCPVSCIKEGDSQYEINAEECIECGQCADNCPGERDFQGLMSQEREGTANTA